MGGGSGEWNAVGSVLPVILFAYGCQIQLIDIFRSVDVGRPRRRGGASGDGDGEGEGEGSEGSKRSKGDGSGGGGDGDWDDGEEAIAYFTPVVVSSCVLMMILFSLTGVFGECSYTLTGL